MQRLCRVPAVASDGCKPAVLPLHLRASALADLRVFFEQGFIDLCSGPHVAFVDELTEGISLLDGVGDPSSVEGHLIGQVCIVESVVQKASVNSGTPTADIK